MGSHSSLFWKDKNYGLPKAEGRIIQMADQIFFHGRIYTMAGPIVQALAVKGSHIEAVGRDEEITVLAEPGCRFTDLQGRCVVPGFNDSHCHVLLTGLNDERLDLSGVRSVEEMVRRGRDYIKEHQLPPGAWVRGGGYDHNIFERPVLPDGSVMEQISTEHPVMIERVCGHVGAANRLALSLAGFDAATEVTGGVLDKDETGQLTGILREAALDAFKMRMPKISVSQAKGAIAAALKRANAVGLTSMQSDDTDGVDFDTVRQAYQELEAEGKLTVRIFEEIHAPRMGDLEDFLKQGFRTGDGTGFFKIGNIKLLTDGSLGARTASFREEYRDDPGNKGIAVYTQRELEELVLAAHRAGMQVAAHAIGDGAVEQCIGAFEKAWETDHVDLRNRIVHCQFADGAMLDRMARSHIAADIQPPFVPSDAPLTASRLGERAKNGYVWKSMLERGIHAGGGSDSPVESFDPIWGIHCAVNRTDMAGLPAGGWNPEQRLGVEEAVRLYTADGAYLSFEEDAKGTLEAGKLADFVILSQDIFQIPREEIKDTRVLRTVVGGKTVFSKLLKS